MSTSPPFYNHTDGPFYHHDHHSPYSNGHYDDDNDEEEDCSALALSLALVILSMAVCLVLLHQSGFVNHDNDNHDITIRFPTATERQERRARRRRGDYTAKIQDHQVNIYTWPEHKGRQVVDDDGATVQTQCSYGDDDKENAMECSIFDKNDTVVALEQDALEEIDLEEQRPPRTTTMTTSSTQAMSKTSTTQTPAAITSCPICLCDFQPGQRVCHSQNPQCCGQTFHVTCIGEWLWERPHCPLCRSEFLLPHNDDDDDADKERSNSSNSKSNSPLSSSSISQKAEDDNTTTRTRISTIDTAASETTTIATLSRVSTESRITRMAYV